MAFANLGRNKSKTILVVVSLALSVVLLNVLVTFTGGFDMEKYLAKQTCADFIVSSTDYFRYNSAESYITREQIDQMEANTIQSLSGCGYQLTGTIGWMSEEAWRMDRKRFGSPEMVETELAQLDRRGELLSARAQIEGLDESLFEKLTVVEGDLAPLFREDSNAIAMAVYSKAAHRRKNRAKEQGSPSHYSRKEDAMKKDEWQFFRTKNNRISYHKKCLGCVHDCKQSYRVKAIYCPRYKKRGR